VAESRLEASSRARSLALGQATPRLALQSLWAYFQAPGSTLENSRSTTSCSSRVAARMPLSFPNDRRHTGLRRAAFGRGVGRGERGREAAFTALSITGGLPRSNGIRSAVCAHPPWRALYKSHPAIGMDARYERSPFRSHDPDHPGCSAQERRCHRRTRSIGSPQKEGAYIRRQQDLLLAMVETNRVILGENHEAELTNFRKPLFVRRSWLEEQFMVRHYLIPGKPKGLRDLISTQSLVEEEDDFRRRGFRSGRLPRSPQCSARSRVQEPASCLRL
jgi:hypothetical protein